MERERAGKAMNTCMVTEVMVALVEARWGWNPRIALLGRLIEMALLDHLNSRFDESLLVALAGLGGGGGGDEVLVLIRDRY